MLLSTSYRHRDQKIRILQHRLNLTASGNHHLGLSQGKGVCLGKDFRLEAYCYDCLRKKYLLSDIKKLDEYKI